MRLIFCFVLSIYLSIIPPIAGKISWLGSEEDPPRAAWSSGELGVDDQDSNRLYHISGMIFWMTPIAKPQASDFLRTGVQEQ